MYCEAKPNICNFPEDTSVDMLDKHSSQRGLGLTENTSVDMLVQHYSQRGLGLTPKDKHSKVGTNQILDQMLYRGEGVSKVCQSSILYCEWLPNIETFPTIHCPNSFRSRFLSEVSSSVQL